MNNFNGSKMMIGAGGATHAFPIGNGLTDEQNQYVCTAIYKMKVHDLNSMTNSLNMKRLRSKTEFQKSILDALYNSRYAAEIFTMVKSFSSNNKEQAGLVNTQNMHPRRNVVRHVPYDAQSRNGVNNHMGNNHYQQNLHNQHHVMNHMMQIAQQQQPMTVRWINAEQVKDPISSAAAPLQRSQPFLNYGMSSQNQMHSGNSNRTSRYHAERFEAVNLPFYDVQSTILEPVELHSVNGSNKQAKQLSFHFAVTPEQLTSTAYRQDATALPRFELLLRFFNITERSVPQKDEFPLNCHTRIDDQVVQLPNIIPTNKPNAEPKRPSRPVNVTNYINRYKRDHTLFVEWLADKRVWAAGLYYVYRVNSDILFKRLEQNQSKHRSSELTKQEIIKKLSGGEDDIAMDQLKTSLLDPLSKMRMKTPVRCQDCTHLQCFDLMSYLMMNEKKPTWQCPVCSGNCPYDRLIVENYFLDMLAAVDKNTTEVELKKDGSYDVIREEADVCLSDDDDDEVKPITNGGASSSNGVVENGGKKKKAQVSDDDIITLSDDEDEELNRGIQNSLSDIYSTDTKSETADSTPKTPTLKKKSNDIEIITLDDTPPRPASTTRQISQQNNVSNLSPTEPSQPPNIHAALESMFVNGNGSSRTSQNSQPSPLMQQQGPSHSMNFQQHPFINVGQPSGPPTSNSQFGYPPMMQQQYQMQNGLIGRNNQMAHMQQHHQQQPQGMMSPTFFAQQQMQNGAFYYQQQYQQHQQQQNPQYRQN